MHVALKGKAWVKEGSAPVLGAEDPELGQYRTAATNLFSNFDHVGSFIALPMEPQRAHHVTGGSLS